MTSYQELQLTNLNRGRNLISGWNIGDLVLVVESHPEVGWSNVVYGTYEGLCDSKGFINWERGRIIINQSSIMTNVSEESWAEDERIRTLDLCFLTDARILMNKKDLEELKRVGGSVSK